MHDSVAPVMSVNAFRRDLAEHRRVLLHRVRFMLSQRGDDMHVGFGLQHAAFALSFRGGFVDFDFRRPGERTQSFDRSLVGFDLTLASPLPGAFDFLVFGASVNLPAQNILRFRASPRLDAPRLALYESRVERTAAAVRNAPTNGETLP